ncbi:hypothetical protein GCM10011365_06890 [Marinicella pacifica]|uniref:DUF4785 domain-containing protein n=1 Tax=Marinicella pacifica TaxID=1171543 RepID=A0A917CH53_9GAMM|nr:DUF4785 domain-containing protein [Marinicella pacifica]GGF88342.1 hypothetical protein GCM10011365_06890 [Marinicella pacifica]
MNTIKKLSIVSLLGLSSFALAQYTSEWTQLPQQVELVNNGSLKNFAEPVNHEQQTINFHFSLLGDVAPTTQNQGYLAESKQYWLNATADKLSQGIELPVTSDLAVIRINPLNPNKSTASFSQQDIVVSQFGQPLEVAVFANAEQLKATGMPVSDHTVAMNVNTRPGLLRLSLPQANKSLAKGNIFVVHVFEPNSDYVLQLKTSQQQYSANQAFKVSSQLLSAQHSHNMLISGYITGPNGDKVADLVFNPTKNGDYEALMAPLSGQSLAHGLWEVHTVASSDVNGLKVMRDVSSAFAVSVPLARFNHALTVENHNLKMGLDVAMAGRYEVSAVLSGMDAAGEKQPLAMLMSAAQLNKGQAFLQLELPRDLIKQSGLTAPFIIEQINLKNQSLMVPVQQISATIQLLPLEKPINRGDIR